MVAPLLIEEKLEAAAGKWEEGRKWVVSEENEREGKWLCGTASCCVACGSGLT